MKRTKIFLESQVFWEFPETGVVSQKKTGSRWPNHWQETDKKNYISQELQAEMFGNVVGKVFGKVFSFVTKTFFGLCAVS